MGFEISMTADGTKKYPLHKHSHYEIMLYLEGEGKLCLENGSLPFSVGSIIIVPPGIMHGSESENGFKNISVGADFDGLFAFSEIISLRDNESGDGKALATLIYKNRYGNQNYLSSLCAAFSAYLLGSIKIKSPIASAVEKLVVEISENALNSELDTGELLRKSGYAEDYIRDEFRRLTGYTPVAFLTGIRIKRAKNLIDIFGMSRSLAEISEASGYTDYVYFSKRFKSIFGISPRTYRNKIYSTVN